MFIKCVWIKLNIKINVLWFTRHEIKTKNPNQMYNPWDGLELGLERLRRRFKVKRFLMFKAEVGIKIKVWFGLMRLELKDQCVGFIN